MQRSRSINLNKISGWIEEAKKTLKKGQIISTDQLERKAMLILGCTRTKAREYIKIVDEGMYP